VELGRTRKKGGERLETPSFGRGECRWVVGPRSGRNVLAVRDDDMCIIVTGGLLEGKKLALRDQTDRSGFFPEAVEP